MPRWVPSHGVMRALHFQLSTLNPWYPHKVRRPALLPSYWDAPIDPSYTGWIGPGNHLQTLSHQVPSKNEIFSAFCMSLSEKRRGRTQEQRMHITLQTPWKGAIAAVEIPWCYNCPAGVCHVSSFPLTVLIDPDFARKGGPKLMSKSHCALVLYSGTQTD